MLLLRVVLLQQADEVSGVFAGEISADEFLEIFVAADEPRRHIHDVKPEFADLLGFKEIALHLAVLIALRGIKHFLLRFAGRVHFNA